MELKKQFTFSGIFKKFHEEDTQPIEIHNANIHCYTNGTILIEINSEVNQAINQKKFFESTPIYHFKDVANDELNMLQILQPDQFVNILLQPDQFETELVQKPYEGDYEIEGETVEGWKIKAIISDFSFNFKLDNSEKIEQEDKYKVRLRDLCIDYDLYSPEEGKTQEIVYGLANIEVFRNFSAKIGNLEAEVCIESVLTEQSSNVLSAEMTLRNICENEQDSYETYYFWLASLLSLASGHRVNQVYRIETLKCKDLQVKSEHWLGRNLHGEARGMAVIQAPHLYLFIQQCTKKMTWETFSNRGMGLALSWYLDTFNSTIAEVNFLLLCTGLESLNKKYSKTVSKRLVSKQIYKQIREIILNTLSNFKRDIEDKDDLEKYNIFVLKVENSFASGSYNQVGELRTSLKEMFKTYGVPYEGLFPELEFLRVRNEIVHEGLGGIDVDLELRKLSNLVVRVFLAILEYQGDYMESRNIEIDDKFRRSKHGLICRAFPFVLPEKNIAQTLETETAL